MAYPQKADTRQLAREQRRTRLAAELRSNLRKRKDQARSRTLQPAPGSESRDDQPDAWEAASADERGPAGEVA
jgi:hypothetical protein